MHRYLSKDILISVLALLFVVGGVFMSVKLDADIAYLLLFLSIGIPLTVFSLQNIKFAFFVILSVAFLIFHFARIFPSLPTGVFLDGFILIMFFSIFLTDRDQQRNNWKSVINPISFFLLLWVSYWFFQAFNPNVTFISWVYSVRATIITTILFYIALFHVFTSYESVKKFLYFLVIASFIAALYAFHQEIFGLLDFEKRWIYESPERYGLIHIGGRFRKWSFLAAVSDFGMLMAICSLIIVIIALKVKSNRLRIILLTIAVIEIIAMVFSGTRTAYAMIIVGVFFYALLTINQIRTVILLAVFIFSGLIIYFGPFHGKNINRLRTLFEINEDASFNVREANRKKIQPYIIEHPFGGGVFSTGVFGREHNPHHQLSRFPPDNYYLQVALEKGWIGLIITLSLFSTILIVGIKGYFRVHDPKIKNLYAAFLTGFFALNVAAFAQLAIYQKPLGQIVICIYVLMVRLKEFDTKTLDKKKRSLIRRDEDEK